MPRNRVSQATGTGKQSSEHITLLPISSLKPSPANFFSISPESITDLATSIGEVGILHPLRVRPLENNSYEIISGERRKLAAEMAGLTQVPCIIKEMSDAEAEKALIDANMETRQLSPMEKARSIRRKKELLGIEARKRTDLISTGAQCASVAQEMGISTRQLHKLDKLNDLILPLQNLVDTGRLGVTAGERVASLSPELQQTLYEALGTDIASLTNDEVKRLRQETERGYVVLEYYQSKITDLEAQLQEYANRNQSIQDLDHRLSHLRQKKRDLEYDIMDRQNAIVAVNKRATKQGVVLLQLLNRLCRPLQAARPDIETLLKEPVSESLAPHVRQWCTVMKEVVQEIETALETVLQEKPTEAKRGFRESSKHDTRLGRDEQCPSITHKTMS